MTRWNHLNTLKAVCAVFALVVAVGCVAQRPPEDESAAPATGRAFAPGEKPVPIPSISTAYQPLITYDLQRSTDSVRILEQQILKAPPSDYPTIEAELLAVLAKPTTTDAGREFVCRLLATVGGEASVAPLGALLTDPKMSEMARYALEQNTSPQADAVLLAALKDKVVWPEAMGLIDTLGARRTAGAVDLLAGIASGDGLEKELGPAEAQALRQRAITALGRIASEASMQALLALTVEEAPLSRAREDALIRVAEGLARADLKGQATVLFRDLARSDNPALTRAAAYGGLARVMGAKAGSVVASALTDPERPVREAAVAALAEMDGEDVVKMYGARLPDLDVDTQVMTLAALAARGDRVAGPYVTPLLKSSDEGTRMEAARALAAVGDVSCVVPLAHLAAAGDAVSPVAAESLARLPGTDVDQALMDLLKDREAAVRRVGVDALVARRHRDAADAIMARVTDPDAGVRTAALKGLGDVTDGTQLKALLRLFGLVADTQMDLLEKSITSAIRQGGDDGQMTSQLLLAMATAEAPARARMMALLGQIGNPKALHTIQLALNDGHEGVREAATRALAEWPDATPLDRVIELAAQAPSTTLKVLSARGALRMLELPDGGETEATLARYEKLLDAAPRDEEKRQVIESLSRRADAATLDVLEKYFDDAAVGPQAMGAFKTVLTACKDTADKARVDRAFALLEERDVLELELPRNKWKATASNHSENADAAFDGDRSTRWDTGTSQAPGQWFHVDLGVEARVLRVTLDTSPSADDYPRGYAVYVSSDASAWGEPVATGAGAGAITDILTRPKSGRWLRIVQTGQVDGKYWSIHEMQVFVGR